MSYPKRGEIWRVSFDPTVGAEIKKTRPALVISNDHNNRHASTVTIIPITDKGHEVFPFEVFLSQTTEGLHKDSKLKCQQLRTVDRIRLLKLLGRVEESVINQVKEALDMHLGF